MLYKCCFMFHKCFEIDDYIVLNFCHQINYGTIRVHVAFDDDIILQYRYMKFNVKIHQTDIFKAIHFKKYLYRYCFYLFWCPKHISGIWYTSYGTPVYRLAWFKFLCVSAFSLHQSLTLNLTLKRLLGVRTGGAWTPPQWLPQ